MSNKATDFDLSLAQWPNDATVLTVGAVSEANSTVLAPGVYYLNADTALHFKQGADDVVATDSSNFLPSGAPVIIKVTGADDGFVAVIQHSSSGLAYLNRPEVKVA